DKGYILKHLAIKKYFTSFTTDSLEMEKNLSDEKMEELDKELRKLFEKYNKKCILSVLLGSSSSFYIFVRQESQF
ncbi:hypothetical protein, partial [Winogradskyella sp.]|uniref:hypothetical protein n=1 Tax=Winogradskyella sp. TaxID=1883156 RepID=UPI0026004605